MKAFLNDPKVKTKYLKRVRAHFKADEIIKGKYWQGGKGCAVGCTIHSDQHKNYETELGIPEWLAMLEDKIFEGLPNERAKIWPGEFLRAVKVGVNLNNIEADVHIFLLEEKLNNFDNNKYPDVVKSIKDIIDLYKMGNLNPSAAWSAAWSAARFAAESAAWSAAWSAARSAAESAAWSAAWSAARSVAESAAWSAARSAAESAAYVKFADKLLELLRNCK
jgi:hypothetical protein